VSCPALPTESPGPRPLALISNPPTQACSRRRTSGHTLSPVHQREIPPDPSSAAAAADPMIISVPIKFHIVAGWSPPTARNAAHLRRAATASPQIYVVCGQRTAGWGRSISQR